MITTLLQLSEGVEQPRLLKSQTFNLPAAENHTARQSGTSFFIYLLTGVMTKTIDNRPPNLYLSRNLGDLIDKDHNIILYHRLYRLRNKSIHLYTPSGCETAARVHAGSYSFTSTTCVTRDNVCSSLITNNG